MLRPSARSSWWFPQAILLLPGVWPGFGLLGVLWTPRPAVLALSAEMYSRAPDLVQTELSAPLPVITFSLPRVNLSPTLSVECQPKACDPFRPKGSHPCLLLEHSSLDYGHALVFVPKSIPTEPWVLAVLAQPYSGNPCRSLTPNSANIFMFCRLGNQLVLLPSPHGPVGSPRIIVKVAVCWLAVQAEIDFMIFVVILPIGAATPGLTCVRHDPSHDEQSGKCLYGIFLYIYIVVLYIIVFIRYL